MRRYRVKVRDRVFLWGNASIPSLGGVPLLLSFRVDEFGEPVKVGYLIADTPPKDNPLGTMLPGETYTINLAGPDKIVAVYAECDVDSCLYCSLTPPGSF